MEKTPIKRYSLAFKKQIVREYENGTSANYLRQKYGIGGGSTITGWVRQYGRKGTRYKLMVIQTPEEQNRIRELEARIQELESALAQVTLDKIMLEAIVEVAEQEYGIDVKKNSVARSSKQPTSRLGRKR